MKSTDVQEKTSLKGWGILILLSLVWGSSYILIKKGLVAFNPLQLASLRVSISALAFLPIFILTRKSIQPGQWKYLLVVGFAGSFIPAFLFAFAQTSLNSSTTGILSSTTPLFTLILGLLFFNLTFEMKKFIGVLVGLAGVVLLILINSLGVEGLQNLISSKAPGTALSANESTHSVIYIFLVLLACAMYALSSNTVKNYLQSTPALTISSAAFFAVGIPGMTLLATLDVPQTMQTHEMAWTSLLAVAMLSLAGTVLASFLFFKLVQMTTALFASTVSYLIPVVALGWGVLDGESLHFMHIIGMVLILLGVYLSGKK